MSFIAKIRFAFAALTGHRLRTGLSLLGMMIGVAAVIVLTALGEGARVYVTDQFTSIGTNLVIVIPGRNETTGTVPGVVGVPKDLTLEDARAIERRVSSVRRLAPLVVGTETVSYSARDRQVGIFGTSHNYFAIRQLEATRGRVLPQGDITRGTPVVVLGATTARELFREHNPVGEIVRIGGWRMKVIGVLEAKGVQLGVNLDDLAIIPVATAMKLFDRSSLFRVLVEVKAGASLDSSRDAILELMRERHLEDDITCVTQDAVVSTFSTIFAALTMALTAIAAISLSVAGLGIMNVMLVSVSERKSEIGLLRAVGAQRREILDIFLTEAALLSSLGGLLGLIIGRIMVAALNRAFPALPASTPAWAVGAALAVAVVVGLVFGVLPARSATRLDPVLALSGR